MLINIALEACWLCSTLSLVSYRILNISRALCSFTEYNGWPNNGTLSRVRTPWDYFSEMSIIAMDD